MRELAGEDVLAQGLPGGGAGQLTTRTYPLTTRTYPTGSATVPAVSADPSLAYAALGFSNGAGMVWQLLNSAAPGVPATQSSDHPQVPRVGGMAVSPARLPGGAAGRAEARA